jgi:hypothetical protein
MRAGSKSPSDPAGANPRWVQWRASRLRRAGFQAELAAQLAAEERIDLHQLLGLVDRGCPPALAARILAPVDEPLEDR